MPVTISPKLLEVLNMLEIMQFRRPLRPLKTELLGSEEETRGDALHANIYRNSSYVALSYLNILRSLSNK